MTSDRDKHARQDTDEGACDKLAVSNCISRLLYDRGWSDGDLAERTGLSRSRVNRIKNRRLAPTVHDALRIARALERAVEEVFVLEAGADEIV